MGATYTRQSTYSDGDVITAAHTNDEFNQLLAAFQASSGHTHDGTANEGGPITKMLGTSLTLGDGTAGTDITVTFDGESNDGVLKWMEDEDYFEFSDDILIASTEKIQFRDTAISINSSTDGQLDLVADTEIQLAATTIDINGNVDISGTLTIGSAGISEAELEILDGATVTTDELNILDGVTATTSELNIMDGVTATTAELNIMDGVTTTTTELNIMDGDTSATSTTLADADRVVVNDAGTMKQVALTDFETYFESALDTLSNVTTVGALNSGSITSGFGTIDTGSSAITTTGLITGGSLDIDDVVINGTTIGHTDDTDLITLADGAVTIAGDLTISGDDLTMGTNTSGHIMVADGTNFNPVAVSGDVTIAANGAVTIANGAVETAMVNANVITGQTAETSLDTSNDTILVHDASASALRKTTLASISSALGGITDVVADTSPQLGGNLDMNGNDIVTTSNANIELAANGTGHVVIKGNSNQGKITLNCESNSHGQAIQAQEHSLGINNVMLLPKDGDSTLVSEISTQTLTNKTLTSPKINENVAVTATATELNLLDGVTATTAELNILDGVTATASELNIMDGVTATTAELNIMDGVTATTSELNIMDGVTSTASELNLVDGSSAGTIVNSKAVIYGSSGEVNATTLQIAGTSITATAAELNHVDGVTSAIQTQLDAKASKGFATAMAIAL